MLPEHRKPAAWHCCLLVLTVLIHGTVLTGCAGMRLQSHARFQPPALNQNADPSWEAVLALPVRAPLHVELQNGDRVRGRFRSADPQTLAVVEGNGQIHSLPRAEIRRVLLIQGNYAKQGALWGLGIGAVTSLVCGGWWDLVVSAALLFCGGIGTAAGALIGAGTPKRKVIYEAPPQ